MIATTSKNPVAAIFISKYLSNVNLKSTYHLLKSEFIRLFVVIKSQLKGNPRLTRPNKISKTVKLFLATVNRFSSVRSFIWNMSLTTSSYVMSV